MHSRLLTLCQTGLLALGCAATSAAWEPPKVDGCMLSCKECVDQWNDQLRRYGNAVQSNTLWVVVGEFPLPVRAVPPDSFDVDEARWADESFPPVILREVREWPEPLDNRSFFFTVSDMLVTNVVTHICVIEAVFPDRIIRDPKPFGAYEFWADYPELRLLPPDILREFGVFAAPPFPVLDPSRAYVEVLPGTHFSALLFHVSSCGARPSLDAWWRVVFTIMPPECPVVKGP